MWLCRRPAFVAVPLSLFWLRSREKIMPRRLMGRMKPFASQPARHLHISRLWGHDSACQQFREGNTTCSPARHHMSLCLSDCLSVSSGSRLCRDRVFCLSPSPSHLPKLLGAPARAAALVHLVRLQRSGDQVGKWRL